MLLYIFNIIAVATLFLLPFAKPNVLNNAFYLLNIPFLLTVGFGSVFAGPNFFVYSESSESIARVGLSLYLAFLFLCSFARQFSLKSLGIVFFRVSNSLDRKLINRFCFFAAIIFLVCCLPYWISIDIRSSGIYTLFFDPVSHLLSREETIKLAERTFALRLYGFGAVLAPFLTLTVLTSNSSLIPFLQSNWLYRLVVILIITILSNINGSRSGFIMPLLIALYSLFILDHRSLRTTIVQNIRSFKGLLLSKFLIFTSFCFTLFATSLFFVIVYSSFLRIGRKLSSEYAFHLLHSVASRAFVIPFSTGVANIWAINNLNLQFSSYFGGFPGFTYLFGTKEPLFMLTGSHYLYFSRGIAETTMNMNTSGLFVNIAFWGLFGSFLFAAFLGFNVFFFPRFLRALCANSTDGLLVPILSALMISQISFNITSSTISFFPLKWFLFAIVLLLVNSLSRFHVSLKG